MEKTVHLTAQRYLFFARWFSSKTTRENLEDYLVFIQEHFPHQEGELLIKFKEVIKEWLNREYIERELPREYTKLFHLPEGIKPYESVYRGEEMRLMLDPWVEVRKFYSERGWYMENSDYPEDHVAVELSFMAHLLASEEWQDAQAFFLRHIINWMPHLMEDLIAHVHAYYYRTVADFCLSFLELQKKYYQESNTSSITSFTRRETNFE